ncbi:hypothetical protein MRX96_008746 [Rhipicephalus microplus]
MRGAAFQRRDRARFGLWETDHSLRGAGCVVVDAAIGASRPTAGATGIPSWVKGSLVPASRKPYQVLSDHVQRAIQERTAQHCTAARTAHELVYGKETGAHVYPVAAPALARRAVTLPPRDWGGRCHSYMFGK